jgi:hypothetical protein
MCPLTMLEWKVDLWRHAEPHAAWSAYVRDHGINVALAYSFIGLLAVTRVTFLPDGRFDFADDDDAETVVDLCAWSTSVPTRFATALGVAHAPGEARIKDKVSDAIVERVLREANIGAQFAAAVANIEKPDTANLVVGIEQLFEHKPDRQWRDHIEAGAIKCARAGDDYRG